MDDRNLDQLLLSHFAQPVPMQRLPQLQRNVWQGVAARERPSFIVRFVGELFNSELRFGPAFAAMVVGIFFGYTTLEAPVAPVEYAAAQGLGFELFSSFYSHPLQKVKL